MFFFAHLRFGKTIIPNAYYKLARIPFQRRQISKVTLVFVPHQILLSLGVSCHAKHERQNEETYVQETITLPVKHNKSAWKGHIP